MYSQVVIALRVVKVIFYLERSCFIQHTQLRAISEIFKGKICAHRGKELFSFLSCLPLLNIRSRQIKQLGRYIQLKLFNLTKLNFYVGVSWGWKLFILWVTWKIDKEAGDIYLIDKAGEVHSINMFNGYLIAFASLCTSRRSHQVETLVPTYRAFQNVKSQ